MNYEEQGKIAQELDRNRQAVLLKNASRFVAEAAVSLRDAEEHPDWNRSHAHAAITFMRSALAALELL